MGAIFTGCAARAGSSEPPSGNRLIGSQGQSGQLTAVVPASDLAVGPNQRFLLGLIGPDNRPVTNATIDLQFFKITGPNSAQLRSEARATFHESPELAQVDRGIYVARTDFDEPGNWGIRADVSRPNAEPSRVQVNFQVREKSVTPAIGARVPASRTLTGTTPAEIESFSSARPVDVSLYRVSIDDALVQGKPLAVLFGSPGFCTSRTCGPSLDVLQALHKQYGDRANYIHVEIYKDGRPNEKLDTVPTVGEWGLPSEPWLFVIDSNGRLVDKFEGTITLNEVAPVFARVVGA